MRAGGGLDVICGAAAEPRGDARPGPVRAGHQLTETEPIVGLYGAFADLGPLESHVLDSSAQTVAETVAALADNRFHLATK